jgi:hypothetical protein
VPPRAHRSDYASGVRARAARQDGQRRLTPGYLDDLTDTKFRFFSDPSGNTDRQTLATPATGWRLRLIRVTVVQIATDGLHFVEPYFGTGTNISSSPTKAIDYIRVPDLGEGASRTWSRGAGPVGKKNEVLSIRWTVLPGTSHKIMVEFTEER